MRQFATFHLGKRLFGVDVLLVREITRKMQATPVPHTPAFVRGLINLRGHVTTILDLGKLMGLPRAGASEGCQIILKTNDELMGLRGAQGRDDLATCPDKIGLLGDDIGEVVEVEDEQIEPVPTDGEESGSEYLTGVVMLERQLLSLLNVAEILRVEAEAKTQAA